MSAEQPHRTLYRRVVSLWRRPLIERAWIAPAVILLGIGRLAVLTLPFRFVAPVLGRRSGSMVEAPVVRPSQVQRAAHIGRSIRTVAAYTPWQSNCLAQAIAARIALGASRVPCVVYLGVDANGPDGLAAHAWVCAGSQVVTGGYRGRSYTVVSAFLPRAQETLNDPP